MTKITHKGLWFKYSSLSDEDKKTSKKLFLSALLFGFLFGLSTEKSSLIMWSEIFHPSLFYIMPVLTIIAGFYTIKFSYELYKIMKDEKSLTTLSKMIYLKKAQRKIHKAKPIKKVF